MTGGCRDTQTCRSLLCANWRVGHFNWESITRVCLSPLTEINWGCATSRAFREVARRTADIVAQKAMTQEKAPLSPGLGFVKLDFLIGTKWGSKPGGSKSPPSQSQNRRKKRP
jgi:hypothetical protein